MKDIAVCMIAYTHYRSDARVRRAAETVAALPGYRVRVLALREGEGAAAYELDGVSVQELNLGKFRGQSRSRYGLEYLKFLGMAFRACTREFLAGRADLVHVHNMPNFLVFAALVPKLCGRPLVLDVHDTLIETFASKFAGGGRLLPGLLRLEEALSCRLADRVVCVNHVQQAVLAARGVPEAKLAVVLNAPDPRWFPPAKTGPAMGGPLRLAYFGTLTRRLGVDLAIRAVDRLKERLPDLEFHILGDGEDLDSLIQLSESLRLGARVRFHGRRYPVHELAALLNNMQVVVVPNRRDAATELMLPVKLLEGLALGMAAVAPRLRTIGHYFPEDALFFYEPGEVESLAEAIAAASDPVERQARAARAREFLDRYGWERHRHALIDLYRELEQPSSDHAEGRGSAGQSPPAPLLQRGETQVRGLAEKRERPRFPLCCRGIEGASDESAAERGASEEQGRG